MALIRSLAVWVIIYASQCWLGYVNKWHLESVDFYIFLRRYYFDDGNQLCNGAN